MEMMTNKQVPPDSIDTLATKETVRTGLFVQTMWVLVLVSLLLPLGGSCSEQVQVGADSPQTETFQQGETTVTAEQSSQEQAATTEPGKETAPQEASKETNVSNPDESQDESEPTTEGTTSQETNQDAGDETTPEDSPESMADDQTQEAEPVVEATPEAPAKPRCNPTSSAKYKTGVSYFGRNNYIHYIPGTLPIILSAPHGGTIKPSEIPARTYGTTVLDTGSYQLTQELTHELYRLTGRKPHVIVCRLSRTRLDANRAIKEAAQGNKWAEQAWNEFHTYIDASKSWVTQQCKKGHYFDIHTHGHSKVWAELGYRLTSTDLKKSDATLNSNASYAKKSSIRHLASQSTLKFASLLRGSTSLGSYIKGTKYEAVPSPQHPDPGGNSYFNGGYNTERHGSKNGGVIDGTQIENSSTILRVGSQRRPYAKSLALAMLRYVEKHYGFQLIRSKPVPPPSHSYCKNAKALTFRSGKINLADSTWGAVNENGSSIKCSNSAGFAGRQVYYKFQLKAGTSYTFRIRPVFSARVYLFGDTCSASTIQQQCKTSPISGVLITPNRQYTKTIKASRTGWHTLAIDALQEAWYGNFTIEIQQLP